MVAAATATLGDLSQDPAFIDQLNATASVRRTLADANNYRLVKGEKLPGASEALSPKKLNPSEVNELIQSKISQLESDAFWDDNDDRSTARAALSASKELTDLVDSHDDYIGKITVLQQKYSELFHEMKRHEREHMKAKKRAELLQKEKDQAKTEVKKVLSVKEKLESLCRELQKENKRVKDESRKLVQCEEKKREELSAKFESKFQDIKSKLDEHGEDKLRQQVNLDNLLKERLKSFLEQYDLRDAHFQKVLRTKDLEIQVYIGRYDRQKKIADSLAARAKQLLNQVTTFTENEAELRSQLNVYVEKFKQVEETLNNSNDLFVTFRKEMEQMTKKTKKLEKENKLLTKKSEVMNKNILEMADERAKQLREAETTKKRMVKLENLCRALQAERIALENKITELEGGLHGSYDDDEEYDEEYDDEEDEEEDIDEEDEDGHICDHEVAAVGENALPEDVKGGHEQTPAQVDGAGSNEAILSSKEWLARVVEKHKHQMKVDSVDYVHMQL